MFDFENFELPIIQENKKNNAEIIKRKDVFYLFVNGIQMMTEQTNTKSSTKEMYSSYDLAYGDVLLSGLGFGILPKMITNKPSVSSITIVEKNSSVIDLYYENNPKIKNINIVCEDINEYKNLEKPFDCIFLDHYEQETLQEQLYNMQKLYKTLPKHDLMFAWRTELIYLNLFLKEYNLFRLENKWDEFLQFVEIPTFAKISYDQLVEYIYLYMLKTHSSKFKNKKINIDEQYF